MGITHDGHEPLMLNTLYDTLPQLHDCVQVRTHPYHVDWQQYEHVLQNLADRQVNVPDPARGWVGGGGVATRELAQPHPHQPDR